MTELTHMIKQGVAASTVDLCAGNKSKELLLLDIGFLSNSVFTRFSFCFDRDHCFYRHIFLVGQDYYFIWF